MKAVKKARITAVVLSVLLILGIPLTAVGGVKQIWALLGIGIACIVAGFYGAPIAWTRFSEINTLRRIVFAIENEHCYSIAELSKQLSKSEKNIKRQLDVCFDKCYLVGYIRTENGVELNKKVAYADRENAANCKYCGASFTYKGDVAICPYCGGANTVGGDN